MDNLIHDVADQNRMRDTDNVEAWGKFLTDQEGHQAEQQAVAEKLQASQAAAAVPTSFEADAQKIKGDGFATNASKALGTGMIETGKAVVGSLADAANAIIDLPYAATDFVKRSFFDYNGPELDGPNIPSPDKSEYVGAQVGRSVLQFLVPFSQAAKLLKVGQAATVLGNSGRAAVAGAMVDVGAIDGNEARLSNLILEHTSDNSELSNTILQFFAASPDDSEIEGRLKNLLEGAALGVVADGVAEGGFKVFKGVREYFRAKNPGKPPIQTVNEIAEASQVQKELEAAGRESSGLAAIEAEGPARAAGAADAVVQTEATNARVAREAKALAGGTTADEVAYQDMWNAEQAVKAESKLTADELDRMDNEGFVTRPYVHADAPTELHLSDAVPPGAVEVDPAVFRSARAGTAAAEDMPAVFAYRRAQEALFPEQAAAAAAKSVDVVEQVVATNKAIVAIESPPVAPGAVVTAPVRAPGEFVYSMGKDGNESMGEIIKVGEGDKAGKFLIADQGTGKRSWKTAEQLDEALALNTEPVIGLKHLTKIAKGAGKLSSQLGKGNVLAAGTGAVVTSADAAQADDGTLEATLGAGLIGALGALGIYKGAKGVAGMVKRTAKPAATPAVKPTAHTVRAEATAALKESKLPQAQRLATEVKLRNISPVRPLKQTPVFTTEQIEAFSKAVANGDIEEMAGKVDTTAFNYDYIDNVEDVSDVLEAFTGAFTKQIDTATRGKVSFDEIENMAGMIGADSKSMHQLYGATGNLAERFTAHRAFAMGSALHFRDLAIAASSGDDLAMLALKKHTAVHAVIHAQLAGTETEIARALAAMRIRTGPSKLLLEQIDGLLTAHGGIQVNKEFAKRAAEMTNPYQLSKLAQRGWWARSSSALRDIYLNSALSGPVTQVSNFCSNVAVLANNVVERGIASGIGAMRGGDDVIEREEVMQQMVGMWGGMKDALVLTAQGRAALKKSALLAAKGDFKAAEAAMMAADSKDVGGVYKAFASDTQQFDKGVNGTNEHLGGFGSGTFGADPTKTFGHAMDVLGAVMRTPGGRLLTTSDELFKAVNHRGELYAQAFRGAKAKGLTGAEHALEMARLIENPTDEMMEAAIGAARESTFTNSLGKMGRHVQSMTADSRYGLWIIAPYVRTPLNIMHYAFKRSPITAFLYKQTKSDWKSGGIKRDMVVAKLAVGSMLMAATGLMAYSGLITGSRKRDDQAETIGGARPDSVKIGDSYFAFNRLDPFGMMMSWSANLVTIAGSNNEKVQDNLAGAMLLSFSQGLMSKSYLSGLVEGFEAVHSATQSGSARPLTQWLNNTAATFVPMRGLRRVVKNELDPSQKEVDTLVETIMKDTPVASKYAADSFNVFGEKVEGRKGLFGGEQSFSPVAVSKLNETPAHKEVLRLNIDLRRPTRTLNGGGNGMASVALNAKQYSRYIQLAGNEAKDPSGKGFLDAVNEVVSRPDWKNIPEGDGEVEGQKEHIIKKLQADYRRFAESLLVKEFPELERKQLENRVRLIKARTGQDASNLLQQQ